jgi:erythritol transport system ATP-binding protein
VYEARGITKVYPGTTALGGVSFSVRQGDVHALIGENGAGKSTLVRILAGIESPTAGTLELAGEPVTFGSVRDATAVGIGVIHQELQLFPDLSVAENLFVGRERVTRWGAVDRAAQERAAREVLARLGQDLDPRTLVGALPLGIRQIVEIARALTAGPAGPGLPTEPALHGTRVLLMDEPTSALAAGEVQALFRVIRDLTSHGVGIVYISHHLHELLTIADRVTVLRDGTVVGSAAVSEIDAPWIVERMTGRPPHVNRAAASGVSGPVALEARNLSLPPRPGRVALDGVSLQLRRGEVCGVYGLLGAGRTELFETLLGVHEDARGSVSLEGRSLDGCDASGRVAAGIALVPEDRQAAGLVQTMTVEHNVTLSHLDALVKNGAISAGLERRACEAIAATLHVKAPSLDAPVSALSGGNQQKVVISRAVLPKPCVLLLDDPTRGVDVAAKSEILMMLRTLATQGMAVAFASSDLAEITEYADRVIVMARGLVRGEFAAGDVTQAGLTAAASATAGFDAIH